jgi:23S rRNA pseudouridine955/2504/2580 synthase
MSGVETIAVADEDGELRLDRWFRRHYPGLTHGRLEKLLRTGQIRVDGGRARGATRLAPGQKVRVPPLDHGAGQARKPPPPPSRKDVAGVRRLVIHRDQHVLAINKPPGLAVQGGSGMVRHLDAMLDGLRFDAKSRPRLVHRLDKDTSGVLLLGRSAPAAAKLAAAFRGREARKIYWALVRGVPRPAQGRIDLNLAKAAGAGGERVRAGAADGKRAITTYAVIETAGRKVAWIALMPETGRTHQLRVHCAAIGHPILGDRKYGGADALMAGLPQGGGLHLHARSIALPGPAGGTLAISAGLPDGLLESWRFFGFDPNQPLDPFAGLDKGSGR